MSLITLTHSLQYGRSQICFNTHTWHCQEDANLYNSIIDKERIYNFVSGLNKELDEVRGRTLAMQPLPHIDDIFAEVRRDESRKKKMLAESKDPTEPKDQSIPDVSALVSQSFDGHNNTGSRTGRRVGQLWCDHYNKPHHTRETYWKLDGKPANWQDKANK